MKRITLILAATVGLTMAGMVSTADAGGCGFGFRGFNRGYSLFSHSHRSYFRSHSFYRPRSSFFFSYGRPHYSFYRSYSYWPRATYYPSYIHYPSRGYHYGCGSSFYPTYHYSAGRVHYPPVDSYVRADVNYGPDAVKEFMGVDRDFAKGPLTPRPELTIVSADDAATLIEKLAEGAKRPSVRVSSVESKERAASWISFGDSQFGDRNYHGAAQRYKAAAATAPDVADAYFRTGFAYAASNRFDLAVDNIRRGLAIDPLWVNSAFDVDDLYGDNQIAKRAHIDGLARQAMADRTNENYLFLIGVYLHFDGQAERAQKFFQRASDLTRGDKSHLDVFLSGPDGPVEKAISIPSPDA